MDISNENSKSILYVHYSYPILCEKAQTVKLVVIIASLISTLLIVHTVESSSQDFTVTRACAFARTTKQRERV